MKLFYCKVTTGNFGDDLNPWLWPKLLPGIIDEDGSTLFVGIGSIMNQFIPDAPLKIVFGSGVGYGTPPVIDERKWKIYCLRGPLSAKALHLPPETGITDAAILVTKVPLVMPEKIYRLSYMPHKTSAALGAWEDVCTEAGIHYINPGWPVERVLSDILSTKLLITEAMHGAIVADAFRIPWIPVRSFYKILRFKWMDWCQSLGMTYSPAKLPCLLEKEKLLAFMSKRFFGQKRRMITQTLFPVAAYFSGLIAEITDSSKRHRTIDKLYKLSKMEPFMSDDKRIAEVTERIEEALGRFKNDFFSGRLKGD